MNKITLSLICFLFPSILCAGGWPGQKVDATTNASMTIDFSHHEIHEGDHFNVTGSTVLGATEICEFIVKTPNTTKWVHLIWDYQSTASVFTHVAYEAVTVSTTPSVVVTPQNNNRNSSNTSGLLIWRSTGTAVTSSTILVGPFTVGVSGNAQSRVGGSASHLQERILKQNTWYIWRFTNGADAQTINFRANWYEYTNK
jgi:hypothetical protein